MYIYIYTLYTLIIYIIYSSWKERILPTGLLCGASQGQPSKHLQKRIKTSAGLVFGRMSSVLILTLEIMGKVKEISVQKHSLGNFFQSIHTQMHLLPPNVVGLHPESSPRQNFFGWKFSFSQLALYSDEFFEVIILLFYHDHLRKASGLFCPSHGKIAKKLSSGDKKQVPQSDYYNPLFILYHKLSMIHISIYDYTCIYSVFYFEYYIMIIIPLLCFQRKILPSKSPKVLNFIVVPTRGFRSWCFRPSWRSEYLEWLGVGWDAVDASEIRQKNHLGWC